MLISNHRKIDVRLKQPIPSPIFCPSFFSSLKHSTMEDRSNYGVWCQSQPTGRKWSITELTDDQFQMVKRSSIREIFFYNIITKESSLLSRTVPWNNIVTNHFFMDYVFLASILASGLFFFLLEDHMQKLSVCLAYTFSMYVECVWIFHPRRCSMKCLNQVLRHGRRCL